MYTCDRTTDITRRNLAGLAIAGAGLSLLPWRAWAAPEPLADTLGITCIDYRLVEPDVRLLDRLTNASKHYDLVALAGASLAGIHTEEFPDEYPAFWEQVEISRTVHPKVRKAIVVDHRECGAYKKVYGELTGDAEKAKHIEVMKKVKAELFLRTKGQMDSEYWLMSKDAQGNWIPEKLPV